MPALCSFVTDKPPFRQVPSRHALGFASSLPHRTPALHHLQLLSPSSAARHGAAAQRKLWEESRELGHVWQARFYDFIVRSQVKKRKKLRYIHRNPVRRRLVLEPEQWAWSSFRSHTCG